MAKPLPKSDDPAQSKRFLELAAELKIEGTPSGFERAFQKVASAKRATPHTPKKRTKRGKS